MIEMILTLLNDLLASDALSIIKTTIYAADYYDSDEGGPIFWIAGPIGAVAFYSAVYLRYRNTDKRHAYEFKTDSQIGNIAATDTKIGEVKGVERSTIQNENSSTPRVRLGQGSAFYETWRQ